MSRQDLFFASGADSCAAWLYLAQASVYAKGSGEEVPMVVMAHGLSGTRRDRLGAFAERFAEAGCAALVFDHRGFGDSTGEPDLFEPDRQLEDWRAVISQVPMLDARSQAFRPAREVAAQMRAAAEVGEYLPAVGQPDEPGFINAPDSEAGWRHVVAIGEDSRWRNRVSARWLLGEPYRPVRHAATLHCPWLVCVAEADQVAAPRPAIEAARAAPLGELRTYPGVDHFDIYDGPEHEAVVADEIDFLRRHLLSTRHSTA